MPCPPTVQHPLTRKAMSRRILHSVPRVQLRRGGRVNNWLLKEPLQSGNLLASITLVTLVPSGCSRCMSFCTSGQYFFGRS